MRNVHPVHLFSSSDENSLKPSHPTLRRINVVGVTHRIFARACFEPIYKAVAFQSGQAVVIAPIRVDLIEQLAWNCLVLVKADRFFKKFYDIAILGECFRHISFGLGTLGELVAVSDEPPPDWFSFQPCNRIDLAAYTAWSISVKGRLWFNSRTV